VAECEKRGEVGWGQAENFGGQACVIVVIGGWLLGVGVLGGSDPVKLLFLKAMMLKIRAEMVLE
jgi:hypothetical protein